MDIKLDRVAEIMEDRGITEEDIGAVVAWGEAEGGKLIDGENNLAKKRLGNVMVYVQYNADGSVTDTYSHRVIMGSEE